MTERQWVTAACAANTTQDYEDEEMSEGDDGDEGAAGAAAGTKRAIYNVEGLHDKLEDISWTEEAGWEETLAITSTAPTQVRPAGTALTCPRRQTCLTCQVATDAY